MIQPVLRSVVARLCVVAFMIAWKPALAGPTSAYYLTAGDQFLTPGNPGMNWVVQGDSVIDSWVQHHPELDGEYAIAVSGTVRTLGNGTFNRHHAGSEYTLAGVYTGTDFPYPPVGPNVAFYDGTTNGSANFSVDYIGGGVYRFNTDWTNPVLLFNVPVNYVGISYDTTNDSLWLAYTNGRVVENRSLTGALLYSFPTPISMSALAWDPADNTLWMGSSSTRGTLYQYSKAGVLLDSVFYPSLANQEILGGEFAIPEPSSVIFALFAGASSLIAPVRRRRKRSVTGAACDSNSACGIGRHHIHCGNCME